MDYKTFYSNGSIKGWFSDHHRTMLGTFKIDGVPVIKNPMDLMVYWEIVQQCRPRTIIELGTAYGGSALFFHYLFRAFDIKDGLLISVDMNDRKLIQGRIADIVFLSGRTDDPLVFQQAEMLAEEPIMISHDACHQRDQVLADLEKWAPLVSVGQYLVVEDGIQDFYPGLPCSNGSPGPAAATEIFLKKHPEFELDEFRERFQITYNPRGYLRRIK